MPSRAETDERGCRRVRRAFEETVRPHSTADVENGEPLLESVRADETPLSALGFETLRCRHETLADHRERCQRLADRRQAFL